MARQSPSVYRPTAIVKIYRWDSFITAHLTSHKRISFKVIHPVPEYREVGRVSICYIFHSESGHTRGIIDRCAALTGGEKIEVQDLEHYNIITRLFRGGKRAVKGMMDPIEPANIDVTPYEVVVLGSPVWGGRPTPAINAVIASLKGCEEKKAVIVVTCGGNPGVSTEIIKTALEGRKMSVSGIMVFTRKDLRDAERLNSLVNLVKKAGEA